MARPLCGAHEREFHVGNARNIAFWVVLFLLILALFNLFSGGQTTMASRTVGYSDFIAQVEKGTVTSARPVCRCSSNR